ncbi:MAG: heparin lyase I family protein [Sphaerobacter sp.]|nr:heparin lyase I family protein [Sphaerobacter sp.]
MKHRSVRPLVIVALIVVASVIAALVTLDLLQGPGRQPVAPSTEPTPTAGALPRPEEPTTTPIPPSPVLWSANLESGDLSDWEQDGCGGLFNTRDGTAAVTNKVAHSGRYALQLTVNADDGKDHATRLMRWCEPSDLDQAYFSAWYYFPERVSVDAGWWNIFQFKSRTEEDNDPWWILNVGNREDGTMYVYLRDWIHERSYDQFAKNLPVGQWVHLEVFLRKADDQTGQVTVWQDGTLLFDVTGVQTNYDGGRVSWGINSYSSGLSPSPTVIYVDDVMMSTAPITPSVAGSQREGSASE